LGSLAPGQTVTATVIATLPATGTWPVTFSATHHEPDSVVANDSTTVVAGVGLVGYWQFEEGSGTTTADSSGTGNTGTLVGAPVWTTGHAGNALSFAPTTAYVGANGAGRLANLYTGPVDGDASTPFTIGNRPVDNARNFNGSIDEVRVYNRVLSLQEIQALASGGS
jgi:hypothetical protein